MDLSKLFPGGNRGTIIIATRNLDFVKLATVGSREIGPLSKKKAVALILTTSECDDTNDSKNKALATAIAESLGCLPIALVSAGAQIRQRICSLEDYCSVFDKHRERLLRGNYTGLRHVIDVYATWNISWEALKQEQSPSANSALNLLNMLSNFHHRNILEDLFRWASEWGPSCCTINESESLGLNGIAPPLNPFYGTWDTQTFRGVVYRLVSLSLVFQSQDGSVISLHPLVRAWIRDRMTPKDRSDWQSMGTMFLGMCCATLSPYPCSAKQSRSVKHVLTHIDHCISGRDDSLVKDGALKMCIWAEVLCAHTMLMLGKGVKGHDLLNAAFASACR